MRRVALGVLLLLAGCDGCTRKKPARVAAATQIPAALDVVFDGRTTALAEMEERFQPLIEAVMTKEQLEQLQKELVVSTGIDFLSVQGLSEAGLDVGARLAGGLDLAGQRAIWALPASDLELLSKNVATLMERRYGAPGTDAGQGVLRFDRSFGPEKIEAAATVRRNGLLLVAVGDGASELLRPVAAEASAEPLLPVSGAREDDAVRLRFPRPKAMVDLFFARAQQAAGGTLSEEKVNAVAEALERAAVDLRWLERGLRVVVEGSFGADAAKKLAAILKTRSEVPAGVQALSIQDAVLVLRLALDPVSLFDAVLPPGSPVRRSYQTARAEGRLQFDLMKEILPALSGHFGLALGGGSLEDVEFKALVGNPLAVTWFGIGVGTQPGVDLASPFVESMMTNESIQVATRELEGVQIADVRANESSVVQVAQAPGAVVFASDQGVIDRVVVDATAPASVPPFSLEVRFDELERVVRTFAGARLPLVFRGVWARIVDALTALHRLDARLVEEAGTLELTVDLTLDPPASSP